jgi:hypothetical protein
MTVYKARRKYVGARSNEFGYANYEIVPAPNQLAARVSGNAPDNNVARF